MGPTTSTQQQQKKKTKLIYSFTKDNHTLTAGGTKTEEVKVPMVENSSFPSCVLLILPWLCCSRLRFLFPSLWMLSWRLTKRNTHCDSNVILLLFPTWANQPLMMNLLFFSSSYCSPIHTPLFTLLTCCSYCSVMNPLTVFFFSYSPNNLDDNGILLLFPFPALALAPVVAEWNGFVLLLPSLLLHKMQVKEIPQCLSVPLNLVFVSVALVLWVTTNFLRSK